MRFLSILLNPLGSLFWWLARTIGGGIDRRLGPLVGLVLARGLVILTAVSLLGAVYGASNSLQKLFGLLDRDLVTITEARVITAQTIRRKTLTIEQTIVAEFADNDGVRRFTGRITEPVSDEYVPGDLIEVYVSKDGAPSFNNPEDPWLDAVLVLAGIGIPLIALIFSLRYLRHRNRLRPTTETNQAGFSYPSVGEPAHVSRTDVTVRGKQRVQSYAERQKEDAEVIRRMHEKSNQQKK